MIKQQPREQHYNREGQDGSHQKDNGQMSDVQGDSGFKDEDSGFRHVDNLHNGQGSQYKAGL